jgi:hypothetical protein
MMGGQSEEATKKVSFDWMRTGPDYFLILCFPSVQENTASSQTEEFYFHMSS